MLFFDTFPVFLYIDPAAAGQITAVISGAVISLGIMIGVFRTRIAMFFKKHAIARMEKRIRKEAAHDAVKEEC